MSTLRERAEALKADTFALYLAARDPRTPWYARVLVASVVGYALSPIDLVPDFIPVFGFLDDLLLIPAGIALAVRWIPDDVLEDARRRAEDEFGHQGPQSLAAAAVVVCIWLALAAVVWAAVT